MAKAVRTLADTYKINRSFQKAKRIDADLAPEGLAGYQLNASGWQVLRSFAEDLAGSKQRAFTWTGPYGSGKSSLALLLSAALSPRGELRDAADAILGQERAATFYRHLACPEMGWLVIGIVGRRASLVDTLWDGLRKAVQDRWGEAHLITRHLIKEAPTLPGLTATLAETARALDAEGAGLLLLIDEMGKFLEHAALADGDLFPLQEIAETFGRLPHRCALLGVLHQAFGDYGRRAGTGVQAEWAKIQGRFTDTPFSIGIDEVVGLIAAALGNGSSVPAKAQSLAEAIAAALRGGRLSSAEGLSDALARCAPLHPVTALLLGPISRRRFGQNERSVFSFLSSHEPGGFAEFLVAEPANSDRLYSPSMLWDYLQLNYEPAILASPDGGRWAEAAEAVLRASRRPGSTETHIDVAKAVGLLDLFGRPHAVPASDAILATCIQDAASEAANLTQVLDDLKGWSVVIPRRHVGGWGLFAGSDIDLDEVTTRTAERIAGDPTAMLGALRDLPPVVAKRHYAERGSLRLFERRVVRAADVARIVSSRAQDVSATGSFLLVLPERSIDGGQDELFLPDLPKDRPIFLALLKHESRLVQAAWDVAALERVPTMVPQLHGDPVARRELNGRLLAAKSALAVEVRDAFDHAEWRSTLPEADNRAGLGGLSALASKLCDQIFSAAPCIHNELINRDRPSPSAVAARRRLMHAMLTAREEPRLGIEGEPAELGLYLSLLAATGIHREAAKGVPFGFSTPKHQSLLAAWAAAEHLLKNSGTSRGAPVSFEQVYELWRAPPFGLREGVLPIFALAVALANAESVALYLEGNFVPELKVAFVDRLLQSPGDVGLRWIEADEVSADALKRIASFAESAKLTSGVAPTALEVAKPLVQFALRLPGWVRRTRSLTAETLRVRDALVEATDPYLLLFRTLPSACGLDLEGDVDASARWTASFVERLGIAVEELREAQGMLLDRFRKQMARGLHADLSHPRGLTELTQRAAGLQRHALDLRLGRFVQIIAGASDQSDWVEALCSLAANRPVRDWTDGDTDRCVHELERLCRRFTEAEAARVAATPEGRTLHEAAAELRTQLATRGLDPSQQRAALLLALEQLAPNSNEQEAA